MSACKKRSTKDIVKKISDATKIVEEINRINREKQNAIKNDWGIYPTEYKILIEPDDVGETMGHDNIIFCTEDAKDKFQVMKVKGTLIAAGGNAFEDWKEPIPKIGDKVYFAKYAGIRLRKECGKDKEGRYIFKHAVLCNDKDIAAILDPEVEKIEE